MHRAVRRPLLGEARGLTTGASGHQVRRWYRPPMSKRSAKYTVIVAVKTVTLRVEAYERLRAARAYPGEILQPGHHACSLG